jgi:plasmid stabilization system protein ParE
MDIVWSPLAQKDVEQQLVYLTHEWGMQVGIDLLERIDEVLLAITNNPTTYYQVDPRRQIHKFIVNRYTVLYYQVAPESIRLLTFWDARQDKSKLDERLKDIE